MARQKVSVKNLRVFGQRIPDGVFRKIADELLPGPDPTANDLKNGAPSKAQVLAALCETDPAWRKKTTAAAQREMSKDAKQAASKAGWIAPTESYAETIAYWREHYESVEKDDIAKYGSSTLTGALHDPNNRSFLGDMLAGRKPFPFATVAELVADVKAATAPKPPTMLCGICGAPATRQLPAGLNTDKLGHYCDRHDWRGAAVAVVAA